MDSETFGIEKGHGQKAVDWINACARQERLKLEARLYGQDLATQNFGTFEMFSWMGDVKVARKLIIRASKRYRIRVIEGAYKTKEKTFRMRRTDYAMVRSGDRIIGHLEMEATRLGRGGWKVKAEERR